MTAAIEAHLVSVIIPVRDDEAGLVRTLAALAEQDYPRDAMDVIVVDNGSSRPVEHLASSWPWVTFLEEPKPGSYCARNRGLEAARGQLLAFTDADCEPQPQWLSAGVAALLADERIGLVAGAVRVLPRGNGKRRPVELFEMLHAFPQRQYVERMGWGATANVFTRAAVVSVVGPFNPGLTSGGDKEWGMRAHAAGFLAAYSPEAAVLHPPRGTWRAHYAKLRRVYDGELTAREMRGESYSDVGRVTVRRLLPPLSALVRGVRDPRLAGTRDRVRYVFGAVVARYLGVLAGARARSAASARGSRATE